MNTSATMPIQLSSLWSPYKAIRLFTISILLVLCPFIWHRPSELMLDLFIVLMLSGGSAIMVISVEFLNSFIFGE